MFAGEVIWVKPKEYVPAWERKHGRHSHVPHPAILYPLELPKSQKPKSIDVLILQTTGDSNLPVPKVPVEKTSPNDVFPTKPASYVVLGTAVKVKKIREIQRWQDVKSKRTFITEDQTKRLIENIEKSEHYAYPLSEYIEKIKTCMANPNIDYFAKGIY